MDKKIDKWDNIKREYFLYGHYKKDTHELFYIGIGKKKSRTLPSQIYSRAYQCSNSSRNFLWLRCYKKHGRIVKILYDNLTEEECKKQEIRLIAKFGRIIDNSGILCNISGGGEGRFKDKTNNKKVYVYNLQGILINTFPSCNDAAEFYGLDRRNVSVAANMKRISCGDFQFRYEYNKGLDIKNLIKSPRKKAKPILCINIDTGQELAFSSSYKFQQFLGISTNAHILECLNGKRDNVKRWRVRFI